MEGTRDCDNHIAAYCTRSADDFAASDFFEFENTLDVDGDLEDDPVSYEFIHAAWRLLHDNTDLIRFAFCWVRGDRSEGQDVIDHLSHTWPFRVHLRGDPTCKPGGFMHAARDLGRGGRMAICTSTTQWSNHLRGWSSGDAKQRLCAATNLASVMLHELCHVVWIALTPASDAQGNCVDTYLIQNAFAWAVFTRYPDALDAACCSRFLDSSGYSLDADLFAEDVWRGIAPC